MTVETAKQNPEQQSGKPPEQKTTPASAQEAAVRGQTREGLDTMRQEITDGNNKLKELQEKAKTYRTQLEWTKNPKEEIGVLDMGAKLIDTGIDSAFSDNIKDKLTEYGLGEDSNIKTIKEAAKQLALEHYQRTGKEIMKTKDYLQGEFKTNLLAVTENLKKLYEDNKDKLKSPLDGMEKFANFCGIQFIKNGQLQKDEIIQLLLLDKPSQEQLSSGFVEYFNLEQKLNALSSEASTQDITENTSEEDLIKKIKLKNTIQVTITDPGTQEQEIKAQISAQLPDNINEKAKEKYLNAVFEKLKSQNPSKNEIFEVDSKNNWNKKEPGPPTKDSDESKETAKEETPDIKTGIGWLDSTLGFIKTISPDFYKTLAGFFAKFGLSATTEKTEFPNLSETEIKQAKAFKEIALKIKISKDVLKILFEDTENFKKLLKQQKDENLDWDKYIAKYITENELQDLKSKNEKNDSGEKILKMFLADTEDLA